jgi:hypothetical protein
MLRRTASPALYRHNGFAGRRQLVQRRVHAIVVVLALAFVFAAPNGASGYRAAVAPVAVTGFGEQSTTVRVWVNTASGVYHCPGSRYYGATKRGKYLSEQDARIQGYRAAGSSSCGGPAYGDAARAPDVPRDSSDLRDRISSTKVWVNTKSGVYHCPGTRYYGATRMGKYLPEASARDSGYRPAYGRTCG